MSTKETFYDNACNLAIITYNIITRINWSFNNKVHRNYTFKNVAVTIKKMFIYGKKYTHFCMNFKL